MPFNIAVCKEIFFYLINVKEDLTATSTLREMDKKCTYNIVKIDKIIGIP